MRRAARTIAFGALALLCAPAASCKAPATERPETAEERLVRRIDDALGGREAWERTRVICWRFFGGREHVWDKARGFARIDGLETEAGLATLVLDLREAPAVLRGSAWLDGEEVRDEAVLGPLLEAGWRVWVNDSYWMFMPYKLADEGVVLRALGTSTLLDGSPSELLELTFEGVGVTPQNRYVIDVDARTGLVRQWSFWPSATDEEPRFTLPWNGWQRFGGIMLATEHGRAADWAIEVLDEVPEGTFGGLDE